MLVVVVAVASRSSAPTPGSSGAARPAHWAVDVLTSLFLVGFVLGTVLLLVGVILYPQPLLHALSAHARGRRRVLPVVLLGGAAVLAALAVRHLLGGGDGSTDPTGGAGATRTPGLSPHAEAYQPSFALVPVVVTVLILLVGTLAATLSYRARGTATAAGEGGIPDALGDVLDEALDDLRAQVDPRQAVIAAYARLERVLAAYGVPRRPSEAPHEYLERVLAFLDVPPAAVARLTALFETAKFSQHDVGATMKEEAIEALETARDELRLMAERERAEQDAALAAAQRRTTA